MKLSCLLFMAQPVTRAPLVSFLFVSTSVYAFNQLCMCAHGIRFLLLNSFKMFFKKSILQLGLDGYAKPARAMPLEHPTPQRRHSAFLLNLTLWSAA